MGFLQLVSTRSFAPEVRLARWNDYVRQRFDGMHIDSAPDMVAQLVSCELGKITVSLATSQRATITRWNCQAPHATGTHRLLHLQHRGFSVTDQRGRCVPIGAGDLTHCIPDEPYGIQISDGNAMIVVDLPEQALNLGAARTCDLVARRTPAVGLLHDFALSLLHQHWSDDVEREEMALLEQTIVGLAQRCFRNLPPAPWVALPEDDRQRVLSFIETNLENSALRTNGIAASLSLSTRAVQAIFIGMATTPSAYIINRRLSRAADVLTTSPTASITGLAYDLGFSDAAHLCRRFKQRFGISPGAFARRRRLERN